MKHQVLDESGGPIAELALLMPLLGACLFGAVQLGQLAVVATDATNAAKASAQYAAQDSTTAENTAMMLAMAKADTGTIPGQVGTLDMPQALDLPAVTSCVDTTGKTVAYSGGTAGSYSCSYCDCSSPDSAAMPFACSAYTANSCAGTSHFEQVIVVNTHIRMMTIVAVPGLPTTFDVYGRATEKRLQ